MTKSQLSNKFNDPHIDKNEKINDQPEMRWASIWIAAIIIFLVAVQFSIYISSLWPYMSMIDPTADQTFYGFTLAAYSAGQMISSPLFGYWNNRLKRARPIVAVGISFSIAGNVIYMFTEAFPHNRKWIIAGGRFLGGFGAGVVGTLRAYIATSSTPQTRSRAIAIGTAALALGVTAGPAIQACTTPIGYPGFVSGPLHVSEYTAPAIISIAGALIMLVLLFTAFKERLIGIDEKKTQDPYHFVPKYDTVAALLCIFCWFAIFFAITNNETVESPYTMAIYDWSNSEAVQYNSIILTTSTAISCVVYVAIAIIGNKMNEKIMLMIGLSLLCGFYIVTFPWPFFTGKLDFKNEPGDMEKPYSNATATFPSSTPNSTGPVESVGCDSYMEWCKYTPRVPLPVYLAAYPMHSIGFPLSNAAASTLFAKILGPRRQGFMQSLMIMAGSCARLLGPILISFLFDKFGPRVAWTMTAAVIATNICSTAILFHRLVPLNLKPKMWSGDKVAYDGGTLYRF